MSNKLEQFKFELEKNIGIYKHAGKYCCKQHAQIPCKDEVWILRIRPLTFTTKVNAQSISYLNIVKKG